MKNNVYEFVFTFWIIGKRFKINNLLGAYKLILIKFSANKNKICS